MNRTLTFEIPEELYETFEKMAAKYGKTTEQHSPKHSQPIAISSTKDSLVC
jgi:hypothetical protein